MAQVTGITIGIALGSFLLGIATYFLISRTREKDRDSFLSEGVTGFPKTLPARQSATFRTGNSMVIKFFPSKSYNAPGSQAVGVSSDHDAPRLPPL